MCPTWTHFVLRNLGLHSPDCEVRKIRYTRIFRDEICPIRVYFVIHEIEVYTTSISWIEMCPTRTHFVLRNIRYTGTFRHSRNRDLHDLDFVNRKIAYAAIFRRNIAYTATFRPRNMFCTGIFRGILKIAILGTFTKLDSGTASILNAFQNEKRLKYLPQHWHF